MRLTTMQENFVQGIVMGKTQYQAYLDAYPNSRKWKRSHVETNASLLLDQPKIIERRRALGKPLLEKNMVTAERVINELAKIAFSDIKDYLSFRTEKVECDKPETDENNQQTMYKYKIIIETKDGKEVDGTVINEVSLSKDGTFKFKLYDKLSALEKLGKTLGIFVEKIEHSGKLEMPDIIIGK